MKVGLLATSYPRFEGDHAGHFVEGFARALAAGGHRVTVVAPAHPPTPRRRAIERTASESAESHADRIDVHRVRYLYPSRLQTVFYGNGAPESLRSYLHWPGAAAFCAALYRKARSLSPDIDAWVTHWAVPCGVIAAQLARGQPHLCVMHETDVRLLERMPSGRAVARTIERGSTALWFLTEALRDRFFALVGSAQQSAARVHVAPMGVTAPAPLGEVVRATPDETGLLFVGRLVPLKGAHLLLHAAARLRPAPWVDIAGDGPARSDLEALARRLGVRARFHGHVGEAKKHSLFRQADALVAPSVRLQSGAQDGVPTVLLEAMAHGTPVLAARAGGIPALVRHRENGLLFSPTAKSLASTVQQLRNDSALRQRIAKGGVQTAAALDWGALAPTINALVQPSPTA